MDLVAEGCDIALKADPEHRRELTAVHWINRPAGRLYVVDIVWLG